jgi:hypothetical protein
MQNPQVCEIYTTNHGRRERISLFPEPSMIDDSWRIVIGAEKMPMLGEL